MTTKETFHHPKIKTGAKNEKNNSDIPFAKFYYDSFLRSVWTQR